MCVRVCVGAYMRGSMCMSLCKALVCNLQSRMCGLETYFCTFVHLHARVYLTDIDFQVSLWIYCMRLSMRVRMPEIASLTAAVL